MAVMTPPTRDIEVLVVGAGPVGLSAALTLSLAGVETAVLEAGPDVDTRMRASTFHPPTLDQIDALGLSVKLEAQGLAVPRWQYRQHETGREVSFDLSAIADRTNHPYRLQCEQHRYAALALRALAERSISVTCRFLRQTLHPMPVRG